MALDATVKGTSSNSFATVVQANAYFADRLGADSWNSIGDEIMSLTGSASISGVYSSSDDQTEVTVAESSNVLLKFLGSKPYLG